MNLLAALGPWSPIILAVIQLLFGLYVFAMRKGFPSRKEFEELEDKHEDQKNKIDDLSMQLKYLERSLEKLPDAEAIHALSLQITRLEGELKNVFTFSERMQKQFDMIDDFLKRGGGK